MLGEIKILAAASILLILGIAFPITIPLIFPEPKPYSDLLNIISGSLLVVLSIILVRLVQLKIKTAYKPAIKIPNLFVGYWIGLKNIPLVLFSMIREVWNLLTGKF